MPYRIAHTRGLHWVERPTYIAMNTKMFYPLFLCVLVSVVYLGVSENGFLDNYDDAQYVTENPVVLNGLSAEGIRWAFAEYYSANWHPFTWISHMLDVTMYGVHPGGHHFTSLLLHCVNVLLLYFFVLRIVGKRMAAVCIAGIFGIHPVHVESVVWISERKDVLSAFFFFLALHAYIGYAKKKRGSWYAGALVAFVVGLLSKPMLVTLPVVLLVLDFWPLQRMQRDRKNGYRFLVEKIPFFLLAGISSLLTLHAQSAWGAVASLGTRPFSMRMYNAVVSFFRYHVHLVVPSHLAGLYPFPEKVSMVLLITGILFSGLYLYFMVRWMRSRPWLTSGMMWCAVMLLPVIGIIQVGSQAMADRYLYLPAVGIYLGFGWEIYHSIQKNRYVAVFLRTGYLLWVLFLIVKTIEYIPVWKSNSSLFCHAADNTKNNYIAQTNCGAGLMEEKKYKEALGRFRQALTMRPGYERIYTNMGLCFSETGQYDSAVHYLHRAVSAGIHPWKAWNNLGSVYLTAGAPDSALFCFQQGLRDTVSAWELLVNAGLAYSRMGNSDSSIEYYTRALHYNPLHPGIWLLRADAYSTNTDCQSAIKDYKKVLEIDTSNTRAHAGISRCRMQERRLRRVKNRK